MVTRKIIYSLFIGAFISSCALFTDDYYDKKALTYRNQFVFDNQFRMDGMYLMKDQYGIYLHYFFQNGSYYAAGTSNAIGVECVQIDPRVREILSAWGCFIVDDNILKVQTFTEARYYPLNKLKVKERWAEIVNDTTIHFFREISPQGKARDLDETFHFRHCTNKPDSMNILMRD